MQSASEQDIPAGMKPWSGGDSAPEDYVRGKVMFRNGALSSFEEGPWNWRDDGALSDIIAYTPSPAPMVEQAGEVIQADRDTAADYWLAAFRHDSANLDAQFIREGRQDGKPLVQAFARHRLNTRPAPAETEGVGEDVIERAATAMSAAHGFAWENCAQDQWRDDARIAFAASTPPVNAGMLRERAISAAYLAIYGEGMDPFEHPEGWEYATAIADAIHAVLNSQAHQIREGDHD